MNITSKELFTLFAPLVIALHEKKVLDLAELPHYYEDALVRRKLDMKEDSADLAFLEQTIRGLHLLAESVIRPGNTRQP